jgi:hypothetical protein
MDWTIIAQAIFILGLAFCLLGLVRNEHVKRFVDKYLEEESIFTQERINNGKGFDTLRRYNALPSYEKMVLQFWVPINKYRKQLSDFYQD